MHHQDVFGRGSLAADEITAHEPAAEAPWADHADVRRASTRRRWSHRCANSRSCRTLSCISIAVAHDLRCLLGTISSLPPLADASVRVQGPRRAQGHSTALVMHLELSAVASKAELWRRREVPADGAWRRRRYKVLVRAAHPIRRLGCACRSARWRQQGLKPPSISVPATRRQDRSRFSECERCCGIRLLDDTQPAHDMIARLEEQSV